MVGGRSSVPLPPHPQIHPMVPLGSFSMRAFRVPQEASRTLKFTMSICLVGVAVSAGQLRRGMGVIVA